VPSTGSANTTQPTLVLTGQNFQPGAVVYYDGKPQTTTYNSPTQVTATNVALGAAGQHMVSVYQSPTMSYPFIFTAT
jgi:hypothetical protein